MIGSVTVSRLLSGEQTDGQLSLVELTGLPGSGPGAHIDPWRETFYVLDGELSFQAEHDGQVHTVVAGPGDVVSIPSGVGHAFTVTSAETARYLIAGSPAGIDAFFAEAGVPLDVPELPSAPVPFDRTRLLAAFAACELPAYSFPESGERAVQPADPAGCH